VAEIGFFLLGPLAVRRGEMAVAVPSGKQRVVLATLLLNAGRLVLLDQLADNLWGSRPPPSAPVTVQNYVARLRKALGDARHERIVTQPGGYLIRVTAGELDVSCFEARLAAAGSAAAEGRWEQAGRFARGALELWRGEPLADVDCGPLAAQEVPRLAELRLQALEMRVDADLNLSRHAGLTAELRQLALAYPLRERLRAQLMLALYRDGRQAEALAAYRDVRRVLVGELGVEPGPELRELHQQILAADPALAGSLPVTPSPSRVLPGPQAVAGRLPEDQPRSLARARPQASPVPIAADSVPAAAVRRARRRPHLLTTPLRLRSWAGWMICCLLAAAAAVYIGARVADPAGSRAAPAAPAAASGFPPALGPACASPRPTGGQSLCVSDAQGGLATVFVVRERGFRKGTSVMLKLTFYPPPTRSGSGTPVTVGRFTLTAGGSVRLGPLNAGLYKVSTPGSRTGRPAAVFRVIPPP
jgi:DNA-binding SARP family transcriptional activator